MWVVKYLNFNELDLIGLFWYITNVTKWTKWAQIIHVGIFWGLYTKNIIGGHLAFNLKFLSSGLHGYFWVFLFLQINMDQIHMPTKKSLALITH